MVDRIDRYENRMATYDSLLLLQAQATVSTSQAGKNASYVAATVDLGAGYIQGRFVVDVVTMAIAVALGNQVVLKLELAKDSAFASMVNAAYIQLGSVTASSLTWGGQVMDMTNQKKAGRYKVPFHNMYGDSLYRYARVATQVAGSLGTFTYMAFLAGLH